LGKLLINEKIQDKEYVNFHIYNIIDHLFGLHQKCDSFYCINKNLFKNENFSQDIIEKIKNYMKRIEKKSLKLLPNTTSNLAEAFFSINCKFNLGKVKNLINRGNFNLRGLCSVLYFNNGPN